MDLGLYELFERALRVYTLHPMPGWRVQVGKMVFRKWFREVTFQIMVTDADAAGQDEEAISILGDVALEKGFAQEAEAFFRKTAKATRPKAYLAPLAVAQLKAGKAGEAAETMVQLAATGGNARG